MLPRRCSPIALIAALGCAGPPPAPSNPAPGAPAIETVSVRTSEGTALAFDLAADDRIVFDLLGQIWEADGRGGAARALTDAVRDTAEDLDPSYAPDGRRIVFRAERGGRTGLWLLEGNGGPPRQLTQLSNPDGFDGAASWSPDGRAILFSRVAPIDSAGAQWSSRVVLLDPAADTVHALDITGLPTPHVRDPAWHPDGARIAFVAGVPRGPRGGRVWIVGREGGTAEPLTPEGTEAFAPAFSANGRRLAFFARDASGLMQVWRLDLDGRAGAPVRLTSHADVSPTRIRWNAAGTHVAYAADGHLWRIAATGGTPTPLRFTAELTFQRPRRALPPAHFPVPGRPDTVRAFAGLALSPDGRHIGMIALGRLWVMPVGGAPREVARVPASARHLSWGPDGQVVWSAGPFGEEDLFAADISRGATRRLTSLPGREVFPSYSPDGTHLAFLHGEPERAAQLRVVDARERSITRTSQTVSIDSLELGWTASNADTPVWSPESDALLRTAGGWAPGTPSEGIVTTLERERRRLPGFPDSPIYMQWTRAGLVFVRHAQLQVAPIGPGGAGPAAPLGADPAMYVSAASDGTLLYISDGGLRLRGPDGRERRLGWPLTYTPPVPKPLLIRSVRIIDGTGAPPTSPRDVLIEGGRITAVGPVGSLEGRGAGEAAEVLDAAGKFIMPGLIDLHAHVYRPDLLPGFLYFGITTMRDQGAPLAPLVSYADGAAAGAFEGPRLGYGGFQLYTDWAWDTEDGLGVEPEADPQHAARSVALAALFGAQHVKTRTFRRWDINARLIDEAHRRGLRATGHCAHPLPLVAAGMDAQEHLGFCPPRGGGLVYDDIVQLFRAAGIAVVPTISYTAFAARLDRAEVIDADQELRPFLPEPASFGWMLGMNAERRREMARTADRARQAALVLARAGVTIGTGTDIWQVPSGVHMEMEELVAAGLTPLEAIRAATASAARIAGADRDLGVIGVGKLADLVILDRDPTDDIRNTRRIAQVIQGGKVVDRRALRDGMR